MASTCIPSASARTDHIFFFVLVVRACTEYIFRYQYFLFCFFRLLVIRLELMISILGCCTSKTIVCQLLYRLCSSVHLLDGFAPLFGLHHLLLISIFIFRFYDTPHRHCYCSINELLLCEWMVYFGFCSTCIVAIVVGACVCVTLCYTFLFIFCALRILNFGAKAEVKSNYRFITVVRLWETRPTNASEEWNKKSMDGFEIEFFFPLAICVPDLL